MISAYRLIEECWSENPAKRPTFRQIIRKLESIHNSLVHPRHWKVSTLSLFVCVCVCKVSTLSLCLSLCVCVVGEGVGG
jgi:hypothetical protein